MKFLKYIAGIFSLFVLSTNCNIFAHGALQSLTQITDKYTAEVFYDPLDLTLNGTTILNFYLKENSQEKASEDVTDVWVKISQGQQVIFSGPISKREFGPPSITYTFPKAGQYEIFARYQKDDEGIAEAVFPLTVEEFQKKKSDLPLKIIIGTTGLVAGIPIGFFIPKPKKK